MQFEGDRFQMTALGKKHFGGVVAQFYSPSVKNHILHKPGGEKFPEDPIKVIDRKNAEEKSSKPYSPSVDAPKSKEKRFEFGNILFGGPCNQKCYFCIGHQLDESLTPNNLRTFPPKNIEKFIERMQESNTKKIIFTGTRTDPQLYKYEKQLVELLREKLPGVHISIHTNGVLATNLLNACRKAIQKRSFSLAQELIRSYINTQVGRFQHV
jgi:tRNA A37 methylthiotransferase MiaB